MMQAITPLNRRFWFIHHGRTLPKEGVEADIEIALALSRGNAEAALSGTERLLRYIASRVGRSSVTAEHDCRVFQPDRFLPPSKTVMPGGIEVDFGCLVRRAIVM